jgi:hypothetical protein
MAILLMLLRSRTARAVYRYLTQQLVTAFKGSPTVGLIGKEPARGCVVTRRHCKCHLLPGKSGTMLHQDHTEDHTKDNRDQKHTLHSKPNALIMPSG